MVNAPVGAVDADAVDVVARHDRRVAASDEPGVCPGVTKDQPANVEAVAVLDAHVVAASLDLDAVAKAVCDHAAVDGLGRE